MSELIRSFRIQNAPYRKGQPTMDGRESPFRLLPGQKLLPKTELPDIIIEGVPSYVPEELRREAEQRMRAKRHET